MRLDGRAGRNAFRCGCGMRVQITATPITTRVCTFGDCRTLATTKEPLRLCPDHEEQAALLLAHTAGAAKVRELETGLTKSPSTLTRKYGHRIQPVPQYKQHAPVVYFARRERLIKIGTTTSIRVRMMSLHADALATEPGDVVRERQLHNRFKHLRASGRSREWFHPGPDLIAYIDDLRAASGRPPLNRPEPFRGACVELKAYLEETTANRTARSLTQDGELLGGRMPKTKLDRSSRRSQVHAAITSTRHAAGTAVAACDQSKTVGAGAGGLMPVSTVPSSDLCTRPSCLARWETLTD